MAERKTNGEMRRQAIEQLAAGRAEISDELRRLRFQLNPRRVMHQVLDRHKGWVACAAIAAAAIPVLLILRRSQAKRRAPTAETIGGSHLLNALARTVTPSLLKSVIVSPLVSALARRKREASRDH